MYKAIIRYLFCCFLLLLCGCREEELKGPGESGKDGLASYLNVSIDNYYGNTRASSVPGAKTSFSTGDVIHVMASFSTATTENAFTQYGAFVLGENGQWQQIGNSLMWPNEATEAIFSAYYIPGINDMLPDGSSISPQLLSNLTIYDEETFSYRTDDPLICVNTQKIKYGHSINLRFTHICTYLTVTNLENGIAPQFLFSIPDRGYTGFDSATAEFTNAYQVSREGNDLKFEFVAVPSEEFNGAIFVSGNAREVMIQSEDPEEGEYPGIAAGYFLPPGIYESFVISYPGVAPTIFPYIEYTYIGPSYSLDEDYPAIYPALKANYSYEIDITKSQGITITPPEDDESWDEGDGIGVNVPDFMEAVIQNSEYWFPNPEDPDAVKILEPLENGTGVRLLTNVDFKFQNDYNHPYGIDFSGATFEGGHHQIQNIAAPLFRHNSGNIRNLWLKTARYTITSYQDADDSKDNSRLGLICGYNRADGDILNVRVEDLDITYQVNINGNPESNSDRNPDEERSYSFSLGGLVGSNAGDLVKIDILGEFTITIQDDPSNDNPLNGDASSINLGGIVGQMALGTLSNIGPGSFFSLYIFNNCKGATNNKRAYYVGGAVGTCGYDISDIVIPNIKIDCSKSKGLVSSIGALAGRLNVADDFVGSVNPAATDCTVSGSIIAGEIVANNIASQSYAGGIAGLLRTMDVRGVRSTCDVSGTPNSIDPFILEGEPVEVTYGTGGAFGIISNTVSQIENVVAYGLSLTGVRAVNNPIGFNAYLGNFAGMVPDGVTWDDYKSNATIRDFGYQMIGSSAN